MADKKGAMLSPNKLAMSKALGAAFLNHQVEQLEKTVSSKDSGRRGDRRYSPAQNNTQADNRKPSPRSVSGPKVVKPRDGNRPEVGGAGEGRKKEKTSGDRDADIIVLDASVLVHGISHMKKWSREGRQEIVIVPLEALNTLDLLKKGTSTLAQRARTASRILEAQVGANPRIRVQRDDAFVPWDSITQRDSIPQAPSPEWVRRTICCARWETEHAKSDTGAANRKPKVVLAIVTSTSDSTSDGAAVNDAISASPVPLPAPQPNKHEPRVTGTLVAQWANRVGLDVLEVAPTPLQGPPNKEAPGSRRSGEQGRRSPEEAFRGGRGRRNSHQRGDGRGPAQGGGLVERPPAVMAMMEMVSQPSRVVRVLARGEKLD